MRKSRGLIAVACGLMVVVPMPVAAQSSHDITFHALFPGRVSDDGLECAAGEVVYDPLRAGRTLQLVDDTDTIVAIGVLKDVMPPSRDGMCETSVTFPEAPDAAAYSVRAGDKAIASRQKEELEASGWVIRSEYRPRVEPTPVPTAPAGPATNTGPVVLGGRIELPSAGFALEVPEGWYAFDLSAPDLVVEMRSFDRTTAKLAPNIGALRLENVRPDIVAEEPRVEAPLLALASPDGPNAGESCSVVVEPFDSDSLEDFVAALQVGAQEDTDQAVDLAFRYVELPAGRAAMLERSGRTPVGFEVEATAFSLLNGGRGYTLECAGFAGHADRWLSIAETFEFTQAE